MAGAAIQNFRIGPSLSNRILNVRFEFESNLEASQVRDIYVEQSSAHEMFVIDS